VIGTIRGSKYPDSYIAITAHYDHLGVRDNQVYYGADDNASGTAALLVMAQYFKQHPPQHSLLFIAFDAEEEGLVGSRYFILNSPVPVAKIMLNLNMDMISRNDKNEIYACGVSYHPFLKKFVDSVQPSTTVKIMFGHDDPAKGGSDNWTSQSDHYPFYRNNIPFLYFGVEDHEDYHKPGDTFEKINKSFYYRVATMITGVAAQVDRQEKLQ
jgi:Zn-dependent M28 family amino/carboxypeptidase